MLAGRRPQLNDWLTETTGFVTGLAKLFGSSTRGGAAVSPGAMQIPTPGAAPDADSYRGATLGALGVVAILGGAFWLTRRAR